MHHPERLSCLPCALWFQSGRSAHLQQYHPIANSRHAGSDALSLALYASYDNINFHLESRDCVCQPCYKDYVRNKHNRENTIPRWTKIKAEHDVQSLTNVRHCVYCCGSVCECERIHQWGPENWYRDDNLSTWKQYLSLNGNVDYAIGDHINHVCRTHYRRIFELKSMRKCTACTSTHSSTWKLMCNIANSPEKISDAFSLELGSVHFFDWICDHCCSCYANDEQLEVHLNSTVQSKDRLKAERSSLLLRAFATLKTEGIIFTRDNKLFYKNFA